VSEPVPQRIGDVERDRAAEYLREHMSVGRLTQEEFDERLTAALQARTAADLEPLFADLPAPKPGQEVAPENATPWPVYQPPPSRPVPAPEPALAAMPTSTAANVLQAVAGVSWVLWIIPNFVFGWHLWWLVFIPIVLSSLAGQQRNEQQRREKLWQRQQNPQLPPSEGEPPRSP
jgi:hypothetical protein